MLKLIAALLIGACLSACAPSVPLPVSTVKVLLDENFGSGVQFEPGLVLAAAHVVGKAKNVNVKTSDARVVSASVLWTSAAYDTALLYAPELKAATSPLTCREPRVGENVRAYGNPLDAEFIQIWGRIAGSVPDDDDDDKGTTRLNISFIPGMSGGPVFDSHGKVLGIVQSTFKPYAFGSMVPMSSVCRLLGRTR